MKFLPLTCHASPTHGAPLCYGFASRKGMRRFEAKKPILRAGQVQSSIGQVRALLRDGPPKYESGEVGPSADSESPISKGNRAQNVMSHLISFQGGIRFLRIHGRPRRPPITSSHAAPWMLRANPNMHRSAGILRFGHCRKGTRVDCPATQPMGATADGATTAGWLMAQPCLRGATGSDGRWRAYGIPQCYSRENAPHERFLRYWGAHIKWAIWPP